MALSNHVPAATTMSGESNAEWGELVEHSSEMAEAWDGYDRLPEPGQNEALDAFCERKRLDVPALMRLGAKFADTFVLAFAYQGAIKYRDIVTDRRWTYVDSTFAAMKVVRAAEASDTVIVAEGETDGARLTMLYPECDVAVMPAGARYFPAAYAEQVAHYERVLVGLDNDAAGEAGAAKITEHVPHAQRFTPPAGDWCETDERIELPDPPERAALELIVWGEDLMELEVPEVASWYEHALLPIGGTLLIHGWLKNFKTFLALDLMSSLAQGQDWLGFEPTEEPCKVAVMQFELPWAYYRERTELLLQNARDPALWQQNFGTVSPLARPRFTAGNVADEDRILTALVNQNVSVFLLDPVRRAVGQADINAEHEVRKILAFFERLNNEGITVVFTHHDNKDGGRARGGDPIYMTGSGAFGGDVDSIVSIWLPQGEDRTTSTRRNVNFTIRNAPPISGRGFDVVDGRVIPSLEPFGAFGDEDETSAETPLPAI